MFAPPTAKRLVPATVQRETKRAPPIPDVFASPALPSRSQRAPAPSPIPMAPLTPMTPAVRKPLFAVENDRHAMDIIASFPPSVQQYLAQIPEGYSTGSCGGGIDHRLGIAWLVTRPGSPESTVFAWRFRKGSAKQDAFKISLASQTPYKLTADLVAPVQHRSGSAAFGLMCSSITGHIRYWSNVIDYTKTSELLLNLEPTELCTHTVSLVDHHSFAVVTTHLRIFIISVYDESSLRVKELKKPAGFTGALLGWFGSGAKMSHQVKRVLVSPRQDAKLNVIVLTNFNLQWWVLAPFSGSDVCVYDQPIEQEIRKYLNPIDTKLEPVDIQLSSVSANLRADQYTLSLCLLFAESSNENEGRIDMSFHIWGIDLAVSNRNLAAGSGVLAKITSKQTLAYPSNCPRDAYDTFANETHLVVPQESFSGYIINRQDIAFIRVPHESAIRPLDIERFDPFEVNILAQAAAEKVALAMIRPHGIVRLQQPESDIAIQLFSRESDAMNVEPDANMQGGVLDQQKIESVLQRTFKMYSSGDLAFHTGAELLRRHGTELNIAVENVAKQLVDQRPVSDPRWAEDPRKPTMANFALIQQHIEDKKKRLYSFLDFMMHADIQSSLSVHTLATLSELKDKLTAATALRLLQSSSDIFADISEAISRCLELRRVREDEWRLLGVTSQDIFYSNISQIDDILEQMQRVQNEKLGRITSALDRFPFVRHTNQVFEAILLSCQFDRSDSRHNFFPINSDDKDAQPPSCWFGSESIRKLVIDQMHLTQNIAVDMNALYMQAQTAAASTDLSEHSPARTLGSQVDLIFKQMYALVQILLGDYRFELELYTAYASASVRGAAAKLADLNQAFDEARRHSIQPFVDLKIMDIAQQLAEEYRDFNTLVALCDSQGEQGAIQLRRYQNEYGESFTWFLFDWYIAARKFEKLMDQPSDLWPLLLRYLDTKCSMTPAGAATDMLTLLYLHQFTMKKWVEAGETLEKLADQEARSFAQRQNYLSKAKLSYLALGRKDKVASSNLDNKLRLCVAQARAHEIYADSRLLSVMSARALVEFIVERHRNGKLASQDIFLLAAEIILWSFFMRSKEENEELLFWFWEMCIRSYAWEELAEMDLNGITDEDKLQNMVNTQLYVITSDPSKSELVPSETMLNQLIQSVGLSTHSANLIRATYELAKESSKNSMEIEEAADSQNVFDYYANAPMTFGASSFQTPLKN